MFNLLLLALVACGDKEATTETTAQNETVEQTETTTTEDGTPVVKELPEASYPATEEVSLVAPDGDTTTTGDTLKQIQTDLDETIETIDEIKEILNEENQTETKSTDTTETQTQNK